MVYQSTLHSLPVLVVLLATILSIFHLTPQLTHAQANNGCVDFALFGPARTGSRFEWNIEGDKLNGMIHFNRDNKLDAGWIAFGVGANLQYGMAPSDIMLIWKVDGVIKHSMKQAVELVGKPYQANGTIFENDVSVLENDDGSVTVKFSKKFTYPTQGSVKIQDETMAIMAAMHSSRTPVGENAETTWFIHQYNRKYMFNPMKITNNCGGGGPGPSPGPGPAPSPGPVDPSPSPSPVASPSPKPTPIESPIGGEPSKSVSTQPPSSSSSDPIAARSSSGHGHVSEAMTATPKLIISVCALILTIIASIVFTKHY